MMKTVVAGSTSYRLSNSVKIWPLDPTTLLLAAPYLVMIFVEKNY